VQAAMFPCGPLPPRSRRTNSRSPKTQRDDRTSVPDHRFLRFGFTNTIGQNMRIMVSGAQVGYNSRTRATGRQSVMNIITNTVDFDPNGGILGQAVECAPAVCVQGKPPPRIPVDLFPDYPHRCACWTSAGGTLAIEHFQGEGCGTRHHSWPRDRRQ